MAKQTLTCELPDGTTAQRKTDHDYKFVLVGRVDVARLLEISIQNAPRTAQMNFNYHLRLAQRKAVSRFETPEKAAEEIGGLDATVESYAELLKERARKNHIRKYGEGATVGQWKAIAWSSKHALISARMMSEQKSAHYTDLHISPVL